ncbi:hypothetical protein [Bifidobacterium phasiani]|uniref:Uncharacterized protein n=1 Tax=Bifidobacterium phasiani TaxID=2834431 RepID=A0ABS6W637_9BIFI|nr:hypothetical protein [Bifidobacterium phasiani]MBW3081954.1 hypothetical protein [Bifidobacterium phasiani]
MMRVNRIPSPFFVKQPLALGSKTGNASCEFYSGIGYNLLSTDGSEMQINLLLPDIDAGRWVFSCDVASQSGVWFEFRMVADDFSKEYAKLDSVGDNEYHAATLHFEYDAARRAMLQVRTSSFVNIRNGMQLELAETFDSAVGGGIPASSRTTPCPGDLPAGGGAR